MQLKQVIHKLRAPQISGSVAREINGISYDLRTVQPGCLYVALARGQQDGHDSIEEAIDRGAVAVICERTLPVKSRATQVEVQRSLEALALAAISFYEEPARKLKMIAVAGSFGQTSLAFTLRHLLESAGLKTGLIGSIHHQVGERILPVQRFYSESLDVQKLLRQMVNQGCGACVVEINEQNLRNNRFFGIEFDVVISTTLERNFSFSPDQELLEDTLGELVRGARKSCVINVEDSMGHQLALMQGLAPVMTYAIGEAAQVTASNIELLPDGSRLDLKVGPRNFPCRIPHVGRQAVLAFAGAAAGALAVGLPFSKIYPKLSALPPVPGHLETVDRGQPFSVFVDHADNEEEFAFVLKALREVCRRQLIVVFGCEGERQTDKRYTMGRIAANMADFTIITSDNCRNELPAKIFSEIEQGFRSIREGGYSVLEDRAMAIARAVRMAEPGDCVLIAGKGHNMYQEFENAIAPFDDRAIAAESLEMTAVDHPAVNTEEPALAH